MKLLTLLLAQTATAALAAGYRPAQVWGTLQDSVINESSGLARCTQSAEVLFTHNDSGDSARVFAVRKDGVTVATVQITGAAAIDWEDMALGPGPGGAPHLFLGDIGDNAAARGSIQVYRVSEPVLNLGATGQHLATEAAAVFNLAYEDGPRDAEGLMVHPTSGRLYVVTKALAGSRVYAAPHPLQPGQVNILTRVADVRFRARPNATPEQLVRASLATGAAISPDGKRLVIRTYSDGWEWTIPRTGVEAAFRRKPLQVKLPAQPQGEAICYRGDGKALWISTEGAKTPVHELIRR